MKINQINTNEIDIKYGILCTQKENSIKIENGCSEDIILINKYDVKNNQISSNKTSSEKIKLKGTWIVEEYENDILIKSSTTSNIITKIGKSKFLENFINPPLNRKKWCMVLGNGINEPSENDTNLSNIIVNSVNFNEDGLTFLNDTITYTCIFDSIELNNYTFTEAGIFEGIDKTTDYIPNEDYLLGYLLNHVKFTTPQTKTPTNKLIIKCNIKIE